MEIKKRLAIRYIRAKFRLLSKLSKRKAAEQAFALFVTPQSRVRKAPSPLLRKAERLTLPFHGINTVGYRWPHPQLTGKKVLILHGHESSAVYFDHYVHPLQKKGYGVYAFDAPAHGRSGGRTLNAIDYKNFVLALARRFGPFDAFISHSYGGLALSLALEELPHDERLKVVFIAPATESTRAIDNFFYHLRLDAEVRKEFDDLITRANNKPPAWYSLSRAAPAIRAQVLFLQDRQDLLTPLADVEPVMNQQYPNFQFLISDGLGHRDIYRDKSSVQAIADFL